MVNNFEKLEEKKYLKEQRKINEDMDYKKKYFSLLRDLSKTHATMCERCPIVKSCCGGCNLLKMKIQRLKRESKGGN